MSQKTPANWFEKNPKKTLLIFLTLILLALAYGAEKLLAYQSRGVGFSYALPNRAIRLREYRPAMQLDNYPESDARHADGLVLRHYPLRTDQDGFIMPSRKYDDPDITLAFLGASTTECRFVQEENRFPYLAGVLLEKELGIKINSFNAARSGNHSLHSIDILLNKVLPVEPQIVIMMHNINDLMILLYEKSYWNKNSSRSVLIDMNKEITANYTKIIRDRWIPHLAAALRDFDRQVRAVLKPGGKTGPQADEDEFARTRGRRLVIDAAQLVPQFEMNLQTFINICQARGITPVLMTMASRLKENPDKIIADAFPAQGSNGVTYRQFQELFARFNDAIRQKARENRLVLIDLAKAIPPEKEYLYDVVHYNDHGAIKAAQVVSAGLKPLVAQILAGK
jgi:hypothetical protein